MIHRLLRLVLVFALLANQAVACSAHTHHNSDPANHSARDHIHFSAHSHDGASHSHDESSDQRGAGEQPSGALGQEFVSSSQGDHDRDAIYLGDQDDLRSQSHRLIIDDSSTASIWIVAEQPRVLEPAYQGQRTRAGPFSTYHCAIYLQTSRLLI